MGAAPWIRRGQPLGISFRFAVSLIWPFMKTMVKWEVDGTARLTEAEGGIIVAANHTSWFDPPVVAFVLWEADRPPRFLGKEAVFRIPVVGAIIKHAGQIPVYRETADAASAIRDALAALGRGDCVVIYPEGTMTRDPDLWPMTGKTGAVRLALASGRPLFPMVQWGSQDVMRPYVKEFRILPRKTITVVVGDPIDLSDFSGREPDAAILEEGTERLMDAITALEARVRGQSPPLTRMDFRHHSDGADAS
jgi:1-acyl-sn-glycerol-3-phosphate acyltransferase